VADPRLLSPTARHRFDPVSFVLGSMAVAAGVIVLAGGSLLEDAALLLPAGLIALGVALLLRIGGRREARPAPAVPEPTPPPGSVTLSGAELYDLLVPDPTESFVAEMEARKRWAESADDADDKLGDDGTEDTADQEKADGTAAADDTDYEVDGTATGDGTATADSPVEADSPDAEHESPEADSPDEEHESPEADSPEDAAGPIARLDDDAGPAGAGASDQT
jgi:hypothetical protein